MSRIAAVILAAGQASRFRAAAGEAGPATKLVALLAGEPLVRHVAQAALASRARPVVVVTGHAEGAVRAALLDLQHGFRRLPGLVADGRDMGTVVFPDATLKVYLTASAACRAQRRYKQLIAKGVSTTLDNLCADLEARDARDTSRAVAPLKPAQDAELLDNSVLSVESSVTQVLNWWQSKQPFLSTAVE